MRDQQQRPGIVDQPALQPQDGIQVQVVGGLIQQQQIRTAHQRLGHVQPHAPAAGERTHRPGFLLGGKPQAMQQARPPGCGRRSRPPPHSGHAAHRCGRRRRPPRRRRCPVPGSAAPHPRPARTRSRPDRVANSSWDTCATARPGGMSKLPESGCSWPRTRLSRLDLPLPFSPVMPTFSPRNRPKVASANSTRGPRRRVTSVKLSMLQGR